MRDGGEEVYRTRITPMIPPPPQLPISSAHAPFMTVGLLKQRGRKDERMNYSINQTAYLWAMGWIGWMVDHGCVASCIPVGG